jgi:hypothetical protein
MRAKLVFGSIAITALVAGCSVVMDLGTDGYHQAQVDSGIVTVVTSCKSSADCVSADAGTTCCVNLAAQSLDEATLCTTGSCTSTGTSGPQLCSTNAECGSSGCVLQSCTEMGLPISVSFCGLQAGCTAIDAGTVAADASVIVGDAAGE